MVGGARGGARWGLADKEEGSMGNPVLHWELTGPDPDTAAKFYSELFGWHTESQSTPEMEYIVVDTHAGEGINGGIARSREGQSPMVTFYVEVADCQGTMRKAESLGAKTVVPVTELPMVTFGLFADPQGGVVGIVKSDPEQEGPGVSAGDNPGVGWFEVLGPDPRALWSFYKELFGWNIKESSGEGFLYGEVDTDSGGRGIPGGIGSSPDGGPNVNVYAGVDDLQKYVERAETLGGKTLLEPMKVSEETSVAMFADPQGTWFGLYLHQHPHS
jgi:predicted enzyme related to lactoylglutathione lyase